MEALRLYPLAPALAGECTDDIILHYNGAKYGLPKGTQCQFLNFVMQRHPDFCKGTKGPDEIEPDRWDTTSVENQPFLHTFNNGPHSCPGKPLSLLEGHIFLLQVASRFRFTFPEGIDRVLYDEQMLLRPKDAMPLIVSRV
jgi:cytochrome P450